MRIFCPNCPRELNVRPEHVGHRVACKHCEAVFRVPRHVQVPCPECGRDGRVRTENLGAKMRCRHCSHVARAVLRGPSVSPGAGRGASEADRLRGDLAARDERIAGLEADLDEAREKLRRADFPGGGPDADRITREWDASSGGPDFEHDQAGTEPDLPLADLDGEPDSSADREGPTQLVREPDRDQTRTQFLADGGGDDPAALRAERDRLRDELQTLRDQADGTVVVSGRPEALERDLATARADNVRLSAEADELNRAVAALEALVRERDAALAEALHGREGDRRALSREIERMRREADEAPRPDPSIAETEKALAGARGEIERLLLSASADAGRRIDAEAQADRLRRCLAEVQADRDDLIARLSSAEADRQALRSRLDEVEARSAASARRRDEMEAESADLRRALTDADRRAEEASALADRAGADHSAARSRIETLLHDLSEARSAAIAIPPPPPVEDDLDIDEVLRERDQARREAARLRVLLDDQGVEDPAR